MTAKSETCPLCDKDSRGWASGMTAYHIECKRCGEFLISEELVMDMPHMGDDVLDNRYLLSGMTRWNTERKLRPISLMTTNVNGYISQYGNLQVPDKAHKILQYLQIRSERPGREVKVDIETDYPVGFCKDPGEFLYYLDEFLKARALIKRSPSNVCQISPRGWAWLDEHGPANVDSSKAFVAMWFHDSTRAAYDNGIAPAVESAGYDCVRIDLKEDVQKIDDEIIAEIRQSRFLVGDFTGQRHGVYFEAGFAMGLGIPVIWLCHKDDVDNLHFDTRQYNHIIWEKPEDLQQQLRRRILANVGPGPKESS